eukprot:TRINITY_DN10600_c0_g2_i3.p2 TRINITY_DN10600_c0_g2~~TRINITY_DN10600_c0_g2_i3.p2  ORF type:complete len:267 (-),score=26.85 TRINITY_DN10600_c0_g2_i3:60-860(-)
MEERRPYQNLKILIIGEPSVGKTNMVLRYCDGKFNTEHIYTIGMACSKKKVDVGDQSFQLNIWDTAGQERLRSMTPSYYKNAQGVIIAFSMTDRHTYDRVNFWSKETTTYLNPEEIAIFIVGTKCDLKDERVVTEEEGRKLAIENNAKYIETSSLENINLDLLFESLAKEIVARRARPSTALPEERARTFSLLDKPGKGALRRNSNLGADGAAGGEGGNNRCCGQDQIQDLHHFVFFLFCVWLFLFRFQFGLHLESHRIYLSLIHI